MGGETDARIDLGLDPTVALPSHLLLVLLIGLLWTTLLGLGCRIPFLDLIKKAIAWNRHSDAGLCVHILDFRSGRFSLRCFAYNLIAFDDG